MTPQGHSPAVPLVRPTAVDISELRRCSHLLKIQLRALGNVDCGGNNLSVSIGDPKVGKRWEFLARYRPQNRFCRWKACQARGNGGVPDFRVVSSHWLSIQ